MPLRDGSAAIPLLAHSRLVLSRDVPCTCPPLDQVSLSPSLCFPLAASAQSLGPSAPPSTSSFPFFLPTTVFILGSITAVAPQLTTTGDGKRLALLGSNVGWRGSSASNVSQPPSTPDEARGHCLTTWGRWGRSRGELQTAQTVCDRVSLAVPSRLLLHPVDAASGLAGNSRG
ncbi:hypothetical protein B0T25DRAFT_192807 [Lasiosphaeria hispida]|uniref:Uncharacterized protein n=1 Tax=Lasiosphaeria hispida TaxID=260671 RepID=A0AAJ0HHI0_9PEZI|nr:hypothetical protein B0T25DRAFT_192807 [Lasiosphaeria hispida]